MRLATLIFTVLTLILPLPKARAQNPPSLSAIDRTRLVEVFRLADRVGDLIWPTWSKAPFAVLLVTPEHEFLIHHPKPSPDFKSLGYDQALKSEVYYRKRTFPSHYLATFPAVGGISTIVVGQAENTSAKTSTPWVVTLMHEHFHQLQDSQPNFFADVNALNLSRGDQTGMWMLNYSFPYDRKEVQDTFRAMSMKLTAAALTPKPHRSIVRDYLDEHRRFKELVTPDDYNYLAFQFWKEGIARYTEYHVTRLAATRYRPSKAFRALKDYQTFAEVAESTHAGILRQLTSQKLGESKREVVYSFGAAEGLLLDKINPRWRRRYLVEKFDLGKYFP
ncbi:MAG TPA: hypothetical protein VMS31_21040 [Pyrinomonadaceae bacterium]|nr:hypothetical protein [Pyrinomonadaceae bacterium]